jgi:hypothetical protein
VPMASQEERASANAGTRSRFMVPIVNKTCRTGF